jgi:hypothetical protein
MKTESTTTTQTLTALKLNTWKFESTCQNGVTYVNVTGKDKKADITKKTSCVVYFNKVAMTVLTFNGSLYTLSAGGLYMFKHGGDDDVYVDVMSAKTMLNAWSFTYDPKRKDMFLHGKFHCYLQGRDDDWVSASYQATAIEAIDWKYRTVTFTDGSKISLGFPQSTDYDCDFEDSAYGDARRQKLLTNATIWAVTQAIFEAYRAPLQKWSVTIGEKSTYSITLETKTVKTAEVKCVIRATDYSMAYLHTVDGKMYFLGTPASTTMSALLSTAFPRSGQVQAKPKASLCVVSSFTPRVLCTTQQAIFDGITDNDLL